jgi:hypothetical protein
MKMIIANFAKMGTFTIHSPMLAYNAQMTVKIVNRMAQDG